VYDRMSFLLFIFLKNGINLPNKNIFKQNF
jgi:hypothetical protein